MTTLAKPKKIVPAAQAADVRNLSMNVLEVLAEQYQTRDNTDPEWVLQYHRDMVEYGNWGGFPPVLVYHLPDDRYVLVGGFTRFAAYEKTVAKLNRTAKQAGRPLLEREIPCRIIEGTESEALLASIADNRAPFHRGRKFTREDAARAAEMLIRNEETREYNDSYIGKTSGVSPHKVRDLRLSLSTSDNVPIPDMVLKRNCKGDIVLSPYRSTNSLYSTLKRDENPSFLQMSPEDVYATRQLWRRLLGKNTFRAYAERHGVKLSHAWGTIWKTGDSVACWTNTESIDVILAAALKCELARVMTDSLSATVVYCECTIPELSRGLFTRLNKHMPQIRFMNPDEFVKHFGNTPTADKG